jgi:hypothetical protein
MPDLRLKRATQCRRALLIAAIAALLSVKASHSLAQQANVGVPFRNGGHSFYENVNLGWGLSAPGAFFRFNAPAPPPFGGFDPNGQATLGGGLAGGRGSGFFQLNAGQGSNTSFGSQTVSGTLLDGTTLVVGDQSLRPFVTSVVPVVASDPSPLRERLRRSAELQAARQATPGAALQRANESPTQTTAHERSTAATGDLSVAAIRAQQAQAEAEKREETAALLGKARAAREEGKVGVARVYYQQVLRRISSDETRSIREEAAEFLSR